MRTITVCCWLIFVVVVFALVYAGRIVVPFVLILWALHGAYVKR